MKIANSDKTYFENGAIADFRILSRTSTAEDARRCYGWLPFRLRLLCAESKELPTIEADRMALAEYYVNGERIHTKHTVQAARQ